jgi:hypothetical protein
MTSTRCKHAWLQRLPDKIRCGRGVRDMGARSPSPGGLMPSRPGAMAGARAWGRQAVFFRSAEECLPCNEYSLPTLGAPLFPGSHSMASMWKQHRIGKLWEPSSG